MIRLSVNPMIIYDYTSAFTTIRSSASHSMIRDMLLAWLLSMFRAHYIHYSLTFTSPVQKRATTNKKGQTWGRAVMWLRRVWTFCEGTDDTSATEPAVLIAVIWNDWNERVWTFCEGTGDTSATEPAVLIADVMTDWSFCKGTGDTSATEPAVLLPKVKKI